MGSYSLKMHEHNANPILQLTSVKKLPTAGWINFMGKRIEGDEQITHCKYEYIVKWENLSPNPLQTVARPLLMGYDIEVNSSIPSSMPKSHRPQDKVFQVSCVFARQGDKPEKYEKYILTLGEPDVNFLEDSLNVLCYETEHDLLLGFVELMHEKQPNIIIGYNIFTFDIPYMIERAKQLYCVDFDRQGMNKYGRAKEKTIEWSSSAYKNQSFQFLDAEGRIFVDLLPLVKRDYKMNNYKLKTIASYFLKDMTKDPLDARGIFKCYRLGMKGDAKGKKALSIVAKYCVKDSELVVRLFETLTTWIALCEMSKVTNVPIFQLYTQGQQLKVFSQCYKKCTHENTVVQKDGYVTKEDDYYVGATVFPPKPGVYDKVVPFDFCLSGDTKVSIPCGYSKRIDSMIKNQVLLGYEDKKGFSNYSSINGLQIKGEKDVVKIWFEDGSTIVATPEHKFMLENGEWCEARELKDKYVKCGPEFTEDVIGNDEEKWTLTLGDCVLDMTENRDKTLAFMRMLGYVLTDGCIYVSKERKCAEVYLGTYIDAVNFKQDIKNFSSVDLTIRKRGEDKIKGITYCIALPSYLANLIHNIEGIVVGKRATQKMTLPKFLLENNCPLSVIREFLGGLFGGDGTAPCLSEKTNRFGTIDFKWTTVEKYLSDMLKVFDDIKYLCGRLGISCAINKPLKINYKKLSIMPKDHEKNPRYDVKLNINWYDSHLFLEKIGFRYCINKSNRLTIASSYTKMCDIVRNQNLRVNEKAILILNDKKGHCLEEARKIVFKNEPPIKIESLSSIKCLKNYKRNLNRRLRIQSTYKVKEFLEETNTISWFEKGNYSVKSDDQYIPTFKKKVIDVRVENKTEVYDIEVENVHNFIANGIVSHNCSLYPSTIIAYNISWDTLVSDDSIPDDLCHVMEWPEHIGCKHDPKEIRKAELNKIIKEKEAELKELRKKRDETKNKDKKEEYKTKIEKFIENMKPLRDERSEVVKSKPKHIICAHRKYRWLKKPMGVLPEILTHLLDTRASTKKEMKGVKAQLKELKEDSKEHSELSVYLDVLDQRQLALKVSANSAYGALGTRKGYLPFMPGASCTTYMGRKAIEKAAGSIQKDWGGVLVYGDTD
jgi:DNA polymerase elongation subunit (family B)